MSNKIYILIIILLTAGIFAYISWGKNMNTENSELETISGQYNTEQTVHRIKAILENRHIPLFAEFDHALNAAQVDMTLKPTTVLVFGSPAAGTQLMQKNREVAAVLPLKILVWEDDDGTTKIGYVKTSLLAQRYGLQGHPVIENMQVLLKDISQSAAGQ